MVLVLVAGLVAGLVPLCKYALEEMLVLGQAEAKGGFVVVAAGTDQL